MGCELIQSENPVAIVCGPVTGTEKALCRFCKEKPATRLCDYPIAPSTIPARGLVTTCSAPMCEKCARPIGRELDYCPKHYL